MVYWYVEDVSVDFNNFLIKVLHSKDPSAYFHWPVIEDRCWIPFEHAIKTLSTPSVNQSGRCYTLVDTELHEINNLFHEN